MDTTYKRYLSYPNRELQAYLDKQKDTMPIDVREDIMRQVREHRKELRSTQARERVVKAA
jgi:hypothetical protein